MANIMRPLLQWPRWHRYCYYRAASYHSPALTSPVSSSYLRINRYQLLLLPSSVSLSSYTHVRFRSHALKLRDVPLPSDSADSDSDSDSSSDTTSKKSRNEKKREAKRAVKWAMELADFSPPQIKRILRLASLESDVYEAILLVKRFGRDVKEGKRRQFNYIGRLLREVDPELMNDLIQATKDSDEIKFQKISARVVRSVEDDNTEDETDYESEEQITQHQNDIVTRWLDGLINKDTQIMNEIYAMQHVDFDRQELRRLVRKVHSAQENQVTLEKKGEQVVDTEIGATRSISRFLRDLVKHVAVE